MKTCNVVEEKDFDDATVFTRDDGLQYCRSCGEARECIISLPNREYRKVSCFCQCLAEKQNREERQRKLVERMDLISRYRSMGFCVDNEEIRNATLANDDGARPEITEMIKGYLTHFDEMHRRGQGILFYGPVGTGKSFYAGCIFHGVIDLCKPALMTNLPRLINEINNEWGGKQNRIDRLGQYSLVVIDDLGVERNSDWNNEQVTMIVDALHSAHVPMIITSNYGPQQLADEKKIERKRIYDRILENCRPVPVIGESRRKQLGKGNYQWMKETIGV